MGSDISLPFLLAFLIYGAAPKEKSDFIGT